jgi:hypothetical protein
MVFRATRNVFDRFDDVHLQRWLRIFFASNNPHRPSPALTSPRQSSPTPTLLRPLRIALSVWMVRRGRPARITRICCSLLNMMTRYNGLKLNIQYQKNDVLI